MLPPTTIAAPALLIRHDLRSNNIFRNNDNPQQHHIAPTMLAARDQENLAHAHQTTAASKPLNQGIRSLQPKTPGPVKTPFRRPLNDENRPLTQKGKGTVLRDGPSKLDNNAFVTPAPNRAPLGMKTTNARGQAFKTPLPQQTAKPEKTLKKSSTGRRSARSKIVVAPTEPVHADVLKELEEEDDEPDFGYAPPPVADLPDPPIDFGYDDTFPQFQGKNFFNGYGEIYCTSPTDDNGVSLRQKKKARQEKLREEIEAKAAEPIVFPRLPTDEELDAEVDEMIAAGPKSRLDTVKAKSAASALSGPQARPPSAAMKGTKASEQKRKPLSNITSSISAPSPVSKNTIGFPKAKKAPSIIPVADQMRQKKAIPRPIPIDQSSIHPADFVRLYGQPPIGSSMWDRLKQYELLEEEDIANGVSDTLFDTDFFGAEEPDLGLKDDGEVFQLNMPED
jgi:hypothetical protein